MYLDEKLIFLNLESKDKKSLLQELSEKFEQSGAVASASSFFASIWEREESFSTGIGRNVAIPHSTNATVKEMKLLIALVPEGVDYDSLDGEDVKIIFMFAVPVGEEKTYMSLLAKISTFVREEPNREKLLGSKTKNAIIELIRDVIK